MSTLKVNSIKARNTANITIDDPVVFSQSVNFERLDPTNFVGMIADFAMSAVPDGWLVADGSAVSRSSYARLFEKIGTTWGAGDGSTTFNVPDLRGAFVRGTGSHGSETMADGNPFAGPAVGAFEDDQMQQITGTVPAGRGVSVDVPNQNSGAFSDDGTYSSSFGPGGSNAGRRSAFDSANSPNARTGVETRPFAAGVLKCIKY